MKKKILVIEDEPHISNLVKVIMEKHGFDVMQAFIGSEGMHMAKTQRPNLIILDVMMPNMDGFEVAETLNGMKETKGIPILMLSSAAQFKDRVRGLDAGAVDYLTKPFDKDELVAKVNEYVK